MISISYTSALMLLYPLMKEVSEGKFEKLNDLQRDN